MRVRVAATADASLVAHALADSPMVVCAAPSYFARFGRPERPTDLADHNCLVYSELETPRRWRFREGETIRVRGSLAVNHGESLLRATADGVREAENRAVVISVE